MSTEEGGKKIIQIQPHLLAHTLKNISKKRRKDKNENAATDGGEYFDEPILQFRPEISRQHRQTSKKGKNIRKSMIREYRQRQEELAKEGFGDKLTFSNSVNGETKITLNGPGIGSGYLSSSGDDFAESAKFMEKMKEELYSANASVDARTDDPSAKHRTKKNHDEPKYGCLKGGSKPTYRNWMTHPPAEPVMGGVPPPLSATGLSNRFTQRKVSYDPLIFPTATTEPPPNYLPQTPLNVPQPIVPSFMPPSTLVTEPTVPSFVPPILSTEEKEAREKLRELNEKIRAMEALAENREEREERQEENVKKRKKTIRRKFSTGKIGDKISILIPNTTIRNRVHTLSKDIQQTSLSEIKKFLLKRGFIKVGTKAPSEILRKMYEDLKMLGSEIYNKNGENIVYNFKLGAD